jgi:hypothetical protein
MKALQRLLPEGHPMKKVKIMKLFFCDACTNGKSTRQTFSSSQKTCYKPGQCVVTDLLGPMEVPSLDGFRYFISFLDHGSDHIVPVISAQKLTLPIQQQFKVYHTKNMVITGNDLQIWWTDGGGEFESKSRKKLLEELGITHQTTCLHMPEQNGKAERFNRTIKEHARAILHATHLPRKLWVDIFKFICIMYNMTPNQEYTKLNSKRRILQ